MQEHKRARQIASRVQPDTGDFFSFFERIRCLETAPGCFTSSRYLMRRRQGNVICTSCSGGNCGQSLRCAACDAVAGGHFIRSTSVMFVTFVRNSEQAFCYSCANMWVSNRKALQRHRLKDGMPSVRSRFDFRVEFIRREWQRCHLFLLVMQRLGYPLPRDMLREICKLLKE